MTEAPTYAVRRHRIEATIAMSERRLRPVERQLLWLVGTNETPEAAAAFDQYALARKLERRDRATVSDIVRRLRREGLLNTERKRQPNGRLGPLVYRLPVPWGHMVISPQTPHGEDARSPENEVGSHAETPHGDESENAITSTQQEPTARGRRRQARRWLSRVLRPLAQVDTALDSGAKGSTA